MQAIVVVEEVAAVAAIVTAVAAFAAVAWIDGAFCQDCLSPLTHHLPQLPKQQANNNYGKFTIATE